jgi:alpha-galactosidase
VCFFNSSSNPFQMKVNWPSLGILKGTYNIRDLWRKKDIGTTKKDFAGEIGSHDVLLFKLSPVK